MNNKVLLFLVAVLLLGGVFVLANNQNKMAPEEQAAMESADEGVNEEVMEDEPEEAMDGDDAAEVDEDAGQSSVAVSDSGFEPQMVTVQAGQKVVWTNNTQATANVSSAMHPTHELYPPLNLGNFEPGETVELVFDEPGEYKYHDHLNPSKFGTVVVE